MKIFDNFVIFRALKNQFNFLYNEFFYQIVFKIRFEAALSLRIKNRSKVHSFLTISDN